MDGPRRIAIVGTTGSGKTTLASAVAARLGCPYIELDAIHHLPDWTPIERDEMRRIVDERTSGECWVVDGNYKRMVGDIVLARADTVVWLDRPRWLVVARVLRRSLARSLVRIELWNGNRERIRSLFDPRPERNIVLWAWTSHGPNQAHYEAMRRDPPRPGQSWVRLTTDAEMEAWLGGIASSGERAT